MADLKISQLSASTTPLAGTEVLPIVQSGTTKQVSVANLTAGRSVDVANLTASTGNIIIGTSGKGIDFSATGQSSGMTSELLSDYEEGTWTPVVVGTSTAGTATYALRDGRYTKIGNIVYFSARLAWSGHTGTGNMNISGLPYTSGNTYYACSYSFRDGLTLPASTDLLISVNPSSTTVGLTTVALGTANAAALAIDTAVPDFAFAGWYAVA